MCKYYAHVFACKHQTYTFARFCTPASFTQNPCDKRTIWHTIGLEEPCDECRVWFPSRSARPGFAPGSDSAGGGGGGDRGSRSTSEAKTTQTSGRRGR